MGKSTISMVIFNSYVKLPEGSPFWGFVSHQQNKYLLEMMFMGIQQSVPRSSGRQDHVGQKTSEVLVALRLRCIDSADFAIKTDCYVRQTAHAGGPCKWPLCRCWVSISKIQCTQTCGLKKKRAECSGCNSVSWTDKILLEIHVTGWFTGAENRHPSRQFQSHRMMSAPILTLAGRI